MRTHLIAGLIGLACASGTAATALAQAPLWFTPKSPPEVFPANTPPATPPHTHPRQDAHRSGASPPVSPMDAVVEVAYAPDLELAVVDRITDRDTTGRDSTLQTQTLQIQTSQTQAPQAQAPQTQTSRAQSPLLNTEAMIGPLQNAEQMFSRLDISDGWLDRATLVPSGPRADAGDYLWSPRSYTWVSPVFFHHPLYFEQPNLERYGIGRARAVQPLLSSVHFFGSIPLVPYKTLTHHPRERVYTLGQGRPGNCVPVQRGVILGTSSIGEVSRFWHPASGY